MFFFVDQILFRSHHHHHHHWWRWNTCVSIIGSSSIYPYISGVCVCACWLLINFFHFSNCLSTYTLLIVKGIDLISINPLLFVDVVFGCILVSYYFFVSLIIIGSISQLIWWSLFFKIASVHTMMMIQILNIVENNSHV